jgi:hypothetical protein
MKIPYNKIRRLSTAELPGVVCDPILTFEFVANPSYELVRDISFWMKKPEWNETKRIAAELIKFVILPDESKIELGTLETIQELAEETDFAFIGNLINGWNTRITLERMAGLKKNNPSLMPLSETNGEKIIV